MSDAISSSYSDIRGGSLSPQTESWDTWSTAKNDIQSSETSQKDTIIISSEARARYLQEQEEQETQSIATWETRFGLTPGEHVLENGTRQVVTMEGRSIEIVEYDKDGGLLRKINGILDNDSAVFDTEVYDVNGDVSQTLHVELTGLSNSSKAHSEARMTRTATWFQHGEMVRQMSDAMDLESTYRGGHAVIDLSLEKKDVPQESQTKLAIEDLFDIENKGIEFSLEDMAGSITQDKQATNYQLRVQDFVDGQLRGEMTIDQKSEYENLTNRSTSATILQGPFTTNERKHDISLNVSISNYDAEGNLLRTASFEDNHKDGWGAKDGRLSQSVSVSWYNKGELIRRSAGSLTMKEVDGKGMPDRATIFQTLGMTEEEYATQQTHSASSLLASVAYKASTEADLFGSELKHDAATTVNGDYNTAGAVSKSGSGANPYSISWTDETYVDGELVSRKEHKESATENQIPSKGQFRTGGGLTEDETTSLLHDSSHHIETYEKGQPVLDVTLHGHEYIQRDSHGPDEIRTSFQGGQTGNGQDDQGFQQTEIGMLEETDSAFHDASEGFGTQLQAILSSVVHFVRSPSSALDEGTQGVAYGALR
ncbi:hypothetical protein [Desulfovibrio inopinatus]|uniref:hypothetical protein n=1 Tax=Desulfovibrio inopinatus TaxID=102109 RepID=UPI000410826E|nr:hypothetical protein [Desulfovibrio inopinatus]